MVIDLKYFEQIFDEKTLKKGLNLFEKSKVELSERSGHQSFSFAVDGFLVSVKKKGDKVLEYRCSCHKPKPCEHVSSILFYFQQDILGLKSKKQSHKKVYSKPSRYQSYCEVFHQQAYPYLNKEKLNQEQIEKLFEALSQSISKKRANPQDQFILRLSFITEFANLLKARFSGDERVLTDLFNKTKEQVVNYCSKKLTAEEFSALEEAAYHSVKNNAALKSGAFSFLIPLLISRTKNKLVFDKLHMLVAKRKYKQLYSEKLDRLLIIQLQINLKLKETEHGPTSKIEPASLELIMARAENLFFANKTNKAFEWLELNYDRIKKEKTFFGTYLDYLIQKAKEKNKHPLEIHYLEESFIHGLFVPAQALDRLLHLVPKKNQAAFLDNLVRKIKSVSGKNYFDKIVPLLLHQKKWKELLTELKNHHQKFTLVHEASLNLLPEFSEDILNLYVKHFIETIGGTKPYPYQQKLFDTAMEYIDKLPAQESEKVIEKILFTIGKNAPVYRYIQAKYS